VLQENRPFSFYEEIESLPGSVDFEKTVGDQNGKEDSGEDGEIDRGETSFCLATLSEQ